MKYLVVALLDGPGDLSSQVGQVLGDPIELTESIDLPTAVKLIAAQIKYTPVELDHQSMDAQHWASAFCKMFPVVDEATMIGWFANAIMAGHDGAVQRLTKVAEENTGHHMSLVKQL